MTDYLITAERKLSHIDPKIYGQFIEHFHRQIYGGVFDPGNALSDEDGFRKDVLEAMRRIHVPILRWPGGCFVSAYHWKDGVGRKRTPVFDKAWRVTEPNLFGTDEYVRLCRKIGCEPYICTNAGTGTPEEMSDWVEYCNLPAVTREAIRRKENGSEQPFHVKYWSIGNENYGTWEIGAKSTEEWGRLVLESAKMMKRTDPSIELSAAALNDMDWNAELLKKCGDRLDWISIHGYWDFHQGRNQLADYKTCMEYIAGLDKPVKQVKGLLSAMDCDHIRIAYDEWNLRAWYHPNIMDVQQGLDRADYLEPRNDNDLNRQYTMADAVFSACFLNMCIRNSGVVGMAAFSPVVNTRGMIFVHPEGIVLRSTYYVFDLYVNELESEYVDMWNPAPASESLNVAATADQEGKRLAIAVVNISPDKEEEASFVLEGGPFTEYRQITVNGSSTDSYNDIGKTEVTRTDGRWQALTGTETNVKSSQVLINAETGGKQVIRVTFAPHSVNLIQVR